MVTPLSAADFGRELVGHPDISFVDYVCSGISEGFRIGFVGPRDMSYTTKNLRSVKDHPEVVDRFLIDEISKGRVAGPFKSRPLVGLRCSPIGVVEKKEAGKFRMIMDLSSPKGSSVNDGISKEDFSLTYVSVDDAIERMLLLGKGCLLCKVDVQEAFRIVPVHPDDRNLLGFCYKDEFYVDKCLSMGGRSSPAIFNSIAEAAEWILLKKYGLGNLIHLLDDFLTIHTPEKAAWAMQTLLEVFDRLGIPVNPKKVIGPAEVLEFLGILLDSQVMEARLPEDKRLKLLKDIDASVGRKKLTQREVLSLVGSMGFAAKVIVPARPFLSRLIAKAYTVRELHFKVRLSNDDRLDLQLWKTFLTSWNGKQLFLFKTLKDPDLVFATDAAGGLGFGGFNGKEWFSSAWKSYQQEWSIPAKELFPIVVAAELWGNTWSGNRVLVSCDSLGTVAAINKAYSNKKVMANLLRMLTFLSMKFNFHVRAVHIPGKANVLSDLLSRLQVKKFLQLAPQTSSQHRRHPGDPFTSFKWICNTL